MQVQNIFQGHQINFLEKIWHWEVNISCIQLQALNPKSIRRLSLLARSRFSAPQHPRRAAPTPPRRVALLRPRPRRLLTVKFRQPSHEFTFGVGMNFISYPSVLTPVV
jgi:hypothetical protein